MRRTPEDAIPEDPGNGPIASLVYRGWVELELLGPTRVVVEGATVSLPPKPRLLLVVLALNANRTVSVDHLIDALWGESPPTTATKTLQTYVFQLRKIVDTGSAGGRPASLVETDGQGYRLRIDPFSIDTARFARLLDDARTKAVDGPRHAADLLTEALALWRGPALSDFAYEPFAQAEIERLEELHSSAIEERARTLLILGEHAAIVGELRQAVAERPFHEGLWSCLMLALFRSGRPADALVAYRDAEAALETELGAEPGPELRDLESRIRAGDSSLEWVPETSRRRGRLPAVTSPLLGREAELETARELLGRSRLVTITGAGGSGKTRLAVDVARAWSSAGNDTIFVDLSAVREREHAVASIAAALGIANSTDRGMQAALAARLATQDALVLLDNVEQIEPLGMIVVDLLAHSTGARFLVTSRLPLRIRGEQQMPLLPLRLPEAGETKTETIEATAAVALFVERAKAVDPAFTIDDANAGPIGAICRRLDGLPLAIELAAARVRALPPAALLERLGSGLDLSGVRDLPDRQQTLRRTLQWSAGLLSIQERELFARLAVFAGGWTMDAAERIGAGIPELDDGLASLLDHSLVLRRGASAEPRYAMLETVRAFANELLAALPDREEIESRHASFYLETAEAKRIDALNSTDPRAMSWFGSEIDNIRAVGRRLVGIDDVVSGLRLGTSLLTYAQLHREIVGEVRRMVDHFVSRPREGIDPVVIANALGAGAQLALWQEDREAAIALSEESRRLFEELGDVAGAADQLAASGYAARFDDPDFATEMFEAALERYRSIGHPAEAYPLIGLADVAIQRGDSAEARRRLEEIDPTLDFPFMPNHAYVLLTRGRLQRLEGDGMAARASLIAAIEIWHKAGAIGESPATFRDLASLAIDEGDSVGAVRLGAYAEQLVVLGTPGFRHEPGFDPVERGRAALPREDFERAVREGSAFSYEEAMSVATGERRSSRAR